MTSRIKDEFCIGIPLMLNGDGKNNGIWGEEKPKLKLECVQFDNPKLLWSKDTSQSLQGTLIFMFNTLSQKHFSLTKKH